ncbi:metal-sensitive transcriptional regulator [Clostridium botulinum]|uniref:Metal-sensitive transcriptional regulator n=2 Tax=Clostridium botulinum TaxID=1491 RepID=A0A9Q1V1S5_CLOBO|nr:metal-sensitive transcriptional regulator [Clostridium botulinum]AEB75751.1 conserved protein [Clostridium botulinum BKT015925]KEH99480.1 hypothetical protein Z953_11875 [Clostridium botulinum D str. 16868]KEI03832.1 hypothetical protein Z952_07920 [Clostridium botulinum C/D str. BKT75002]KEI05792.1 hypothetical protein Y848_03650 [Clostridium botulinum C/D str. Sp77]KEI09040.1 hypothetical protein Z954_13940 [Clostridium botulinum C/D str. BKT2873]
MENNKDKKRDIQIRLRKIQGQVKGIENMIGTESCCKDVLVQVAAVRAALNKVGALIIQEYTKKCFKNDDEHTINEEKLDELVKTLSIFMK